MVMDGQDWATTPELGTAPIADQDVKPGQHPDHRRREAFGSGCSAQLQTTYLNDRHSRHTATYMAAWSASRCRTRRDATDSKNLNDGKTVRAQHSGTPTPVQGERSGAKLKIEADGSLHNDKPQSSIGDGRDAPGVRVFLHRPRQTPPTASSTRLLVRCGDSVFLPCPNRPVPRSGRAGIEGH
jgi:hypothetical protein